MRTTLAGLLAGLALAVAGCALLGGEEDEAKQAIAESLTRSESGSGVVPLQQEEAECVAGQMVDGIGVDQLQKYGLLTEDNQVDKNVGSITMSTRDAETTVDAMFDCTDVMQLVRDQMARTPGIKDPQVQRCLEDAVSEDLVRKLLVGAFSGQGDQVSGELMRPVMKCVMGGAPLPRR